MNGGYDSYAVGSVIFHAIAILICVYIFFPIGMVVAFFIKKKKNGTRAAFFKIKSYAVCFFLIFIFAPVTIGLWARINSRLNARECRLEKSPDGKYVGEICLTSYEHLNSNYLIRIYSAESNSLLADRVFNERDGASDQVELHWRNNAVEIIGSDAISLPPTWWDRLRAKLP